MSEVQKGTSRNTENENKRCKIFNKVLTMYVLKKKQKENKNKQTKRKQINENIFFLYEFGSVFNKKMVKSVIYLLFSYQTGYIMRHYIPYPV